MVIGMDRKAQMWIAPMDIITEKKEPTILYIRARGGDNRNVGYLIRTTWSSSLTMLNILCNSIHISRVTAYWSPSFYVVFFLALFLPFVV